MIVRALRSWPVTGYEALLALPGIAFGAFLIERWGRHPEGGYFFTLFDDAAISMTYARTLASTGELVWFPGADRVEGISNLLWTLVMSAVHLGGFSGSAAALAISIVGLVLLAAHNVQIGRFAARLMEGASSVEIRTGVALAMLVTGAAFPLLFWTLRGFETGLIALLLVLVVHRALDIEDRNGRSLRPIIGFAVLSVLLALVRLDGLIVPIVAGMWLIYRRLLSREEAIGLAAAVGLGLGALFAWRLAYYGSPVPNTYYLKVSEAPAALALQRGLHSAARMVPLLLLTLIVLRADGRRACAQLLRPSRSLLAVVGFGSLLAYSVSVGGDAWESFFGFANRFVAPGLGIAAAAVSVSVVRLAGALGRRERARLGGQLRPSLLVVGALGVSAAGLAIFGGDLMGTLVRLSPLDELVAEHLGYGRSAGPSDWAGWFTRTFSGPLWSLAGLAMVAWAGLIAALGNFRTAVGLAGIVLALSVWSASPLAMFDRVASVEFIVEADFRMVLFGRDLRELTTADATIAVVWAGNPAYFADRRMVDLLGKSDPVIARLNPEVASWRDLWPGHNKWDYLHSVVMLQPDVVAQRWRYTDVERRLFAEWGYSEFCFAGMGINVADVSERVDRSLLQPAAEADCSFT